MAELQDQRGTGRDARRNRPETCSTPEKIQVAPSESKWLQVDQPILKHFLMQQGKVGFAIAEDRGANSGQTSLNLAKAFGSHDNAIQRE